MALGVNNKAIGSVSESLQSGKAIGNRAFSAAEKLAAKEVQGYIKDNFKQDQALTGDNIKQTIENTSLRDSLSDGMKTALINTAPKAAQATQTPEASNTVKDQIKTADRPAGVASDNAFAFARAGSQPKIETQSEQEQQQEQFEDQNKQNEEALAQLSNNDWQDSGAAA